MTKYLLIDMANILENLRNRTAGVLRMTQDKNLVEQIDAIKKSTHVDTTLAILLHSNHLDSSWNPNIDKKLHEEIDKRYSFKKGSYKNIEDIIFNYLNGWIIEEDIFWVFYDEGNDLYYDPTDGADKLIITYFLTKKIKSIFPVEDDKAFNLANDFINYKIEEGGLENEKFYPRPNQLMEGVLNEHEDRRLNPPVKPGEHIRLISIDHDMFPPNEYEEEYMPPEHLDLGKVDAVYQDEAPNGEEVTMIRVHFPNLEYIGPEGSLIDDGVRILVDPYDKYVKTDEVLTEAGIIGGGDKKNRPAIPDSLRKNLVKARFERPGGWGRPSHIFILYITPGGKIMDISYGGQTPKSVAPFEIDQKVTFGNLYKFEQDSPFDLRMFGRLREQDEQLNLFPTGDWEFPVGWEDWKQDNGEIIAGSDQETVDWIRKTAPERLVTKIFKMWDENGIDFSNFKLLGLPNQGVLQTFLLKRYIQNSKTPIPVSTSFDCDDLVGLFNTDSRDYNLDYIKEYLCGDDSFWDSQDWYHYEWESYMSDAIDENNWKTISEIFGGVSQSVAEDILTRNSSSEEVDELVEKYDEEIDEIQNFIVWANSDETEWATKDAMATDIKDKIEEHFNGVGRLMKDNTGAFSYIIDGDIRDEVNDIWDNTEDVFQHHPDYTSDTLEGVLMSMSDSAYTDYNVPNMLFDALMDEEYKFWDYCEGKPGDCLEVSTRFMDGYWYPDIDINDSLSDRLGELTYEPQITSGAEGEIKPLHEEQQSIWGNGVMDREKEWCEDDENWLCSTGSENLGFSDLYTDDGFDIIHSFPGEVHLSDLSPEEADTHIPKGTKKYKKLKMKPSLHHGPFNIPVIEEQEQKIRVRTIYEDDNWKYIWPVDDYSFCQLAGDTDWCKGGEKYFEGYGTSYILQDKKSDQKWKFDDREVVPGLPSHDVVIRDKDSSWLNTHRFLANKPALHDMFKKTYTTFDLIKYGIPLDPNILEKFSKTNEFAEAVYKMIKNPSSEAEDELYKFLGDNFTEPSNHYSARQQVDTIEFNNEGVSLYLSDGNFKEQYMGVDEDDDWYFELGAGRYHNYPGDNCEEFDSEEILYVGHHMNQDTQNNLNKLAEIFGLDTTDRPWEEEGVIDETLGEIIPELWENNLWSILDALGCAVGDSRVKAMEEHVEGEKVLDYEFAGGNRGNEIWELKVTYQQLLYIIGEKHINTFSDLEDTEINHIDGGLHDLWYDAYDVDEDGEKNINWEMNHIIDKAIEEFGDTVEIVKKNRETFNKTMTELGFKKQWSTGPWKVEVPRDETNLGKTVTIHNFKPKTGQIEFDVRQHAGRDGGSDKTTRHTTPIEELSDYVLSDQLFESV